MKLQRIRVRHVRGIPDLVLPDLDPGLCLFYGPNESGKSTLVDALHFALFEKSKGSAEHKRSLRTWGGTEAPEIWVDFVDDQGRLWEVHKRFLDKPVTELLIDHGLRLKGKEAENRLREELGTKPGTRYGVSESDLGIWPLLWVRQGHSGDATKDALTDDARDTLTHTLADRTGLVTSGPVGQAVFDDVAERYSRWWTPTGRENADHKRVLQAAEDARVTLDDLEDAHARTADLAQQVTDLTAELDSLVARRERVVEAVRQAKARAEAADTARQALEVQSSQLELARERAQQADKAVAAHRDAAEQLAALTTAHTEATEALARAQADAERAEARRTALRQARAQATDALVDAEDVLRRARAQAEQATLAARLEERTRVLEEARALEARIREHAEALEAGRIDKNDVSRLESAVNARDKAATLLEAASVGLSIEALADTTVDGETLGAGATLRRHLSEAATLQLGDVARLTITPGSGDLDLRREDLARAEDDVRQRLEHLGVDDLAHARRRLDQQTHRQAERKSLVAQLHHLAPDGTTALAAEVRTLSARAEAARPDADDEGASAALPAVPDAEAAVQAARKAVDAARDAVEVHEEGTLATARQRLTDAKAELRALTERRDTLTARLSELGQAEALAEAATTARATHADAVARKDALKQAFEAAGGEDAARAHAEERRALERLDARRDQTREQLVHRKAQLAQRADEGLYDRLQEAREAHELAQAEAERVAHEAGVVKHLHDTLAAARDALQQRFAGPVREAVEASVGVLFPGSTLLLDEDGDVIGLRTTKPDGRIVEETFDVLSAGAREQFGVLVRLGIAQVLAGERRLPIILDDALVNSDYQRRSRMVEVLRRTAEKLQILVFTCHDEDFDRLGAPTMQKVRGRPGR